MALRPPGWDHKLLHLRLAVRAGQVTGSTATMARQVRALLGDDMPTETVLTQTTRIADLEWPADDGCDLSTPAACNAIGSCYTLAQAAEAMLDYQRRKQLLGRLSVGQYDALRAAAVDATGLDLPGGSAAEPEPAPVFGVGDPVPGVPGMVGADALEASGSVKLIGLDIDPVPVEDNPVPDATRPASTAVFIRDKIISEVRRCAAGSDPGRALRFTADRLGLLVELLDEAEGS